MFIQGLDEDVEMVSQTPQSSGFVPMDDAFTASDFALPSTDEILYKKPKLSPEETKKTKQALQQARIAGDWAENDRLEKLLFGKLL